MDRDTFLGLGLEEKPWGPVFSMSNLALRTAAQANGVSRLHGEVSRNMFRHLWPGLLAEEVPIGHVTNGVHTWTFLHPRLRRHYAEVFGPEWVERPEDPETWRVEGLGEAFWRIRQDLKLFLVREVRQRLYEQRRRNGRGPPACGRRRRPWTPRPSPSGSPAASPPTSGPSSSSRTPSGFCASSRGPTPCSSSSPGRPTPRTRRGRPTSRSL